MKIGVSTACLYPLETERALERVGALHIPATEVFINADSELSPSFCHRLRSQADALGVECLSLHPYTSGFEPFLFFSNYPRRFEDGREYYKKIHQAAGILGAKLVVFHGGGKNCPLDIAEYARRYAILLADAREQGIVLAHENVERCIGHRPAFFEELSALLPDASYVLDVKQAMRAGYSPYEMAAAMGQGICHLHLSDHRADADCLPMGEGNLDLQKLKCTFVQTKKISAVLELYRTSYNEDTQLYTSYKILRDFFIDV